MNLPALLTEEEAAALLHVSPRTLRDLRAKGKIRYVRPSPRKVLYTPEECAAYIAAQTQVNDPPCPSINPPKASSGTTTSSSRGRGIMAALAARPNGMPPDLKMIDGGKRH